MIPLSKRAGFRVCLVMREEGDALPRDDEGYPVYTLKCEGPTRWEDRCRVDWACAPRAVADLPEPVRSQLGSTDPVLLTATLRDGIDARAPLIEEILRARPRRGEETVVMPCENDVPRRWSAIEELCEGTGPSTCVRS